MWGYLYVSLTKKCYNYVVNKIGLLRFVCVTIFRKGAEPVQNRKWETMKKIDRKRRALSLLMILMMVLSYGSEISFIAGSGVAYGANEPAGVEAAGDNDLSAGKEDTAGADEDTAGTGKASDQDDSDEAASSRADETASDKNDKVSAQDRDGNDSANDDSAGADEVGDNDSGSDDEDDDEDIEVIDEPADNIVIGDEGLKERTITVKAKEDKMYTKGGKKPTEELDAANRFWKSMTGRKPGLRDDLSKDAADLEVTVTGFLPDDVKVEAKYIQFDEDNYYPEQALLGFSVILVDGNDNLYIPENDITIKVSGHKIRHAVSKDRPVIVYAYEENKGREDKYDEKYKEALKESGRKHFYAADVQVFRKDRSSKADRSYEVYSKNKTYKSGSDAVRYIEAKSGLKTGKKSAEFEFKYGYGLSRLTTSTHEYSEAGRFVVSMQVNESDLDKAPEKENKGKDKDKDKDKASEKDKDAEEAKDAEAAESADSGKTAEAGDAADKGDKADVADADSDKTDKNADAAGKDGKTEETAETGKDGKKEEAAESGKEGKKEEAAEAEAAEDSKDSEAAESADDKSDAEAGDKDQTGAAGEESTDIDGTGDQTGEQSDDQAGETGEEAGEEGDQTDELPAADPAVQEELDAASTDAEKQEIVKQHFRKTATDGRTYRVTADYDSTAGIPDNAVLTVREIRKGDTGYSSYIERSADEIGEDPSDLSMARAFDITFSDPVTGVEYEPNKDVKIAIEFLKQDLSNSDEISVVHFPDSNTAPAAAPALRGKSLSAGAGVEVVDSSVKGDKVAFKSGSFSVYVVVQVTKEQILTASDGNNYKVTVTYDTSMGIPEDAELAVSELLEGTEAYDNYVQKTAETLGKEVEHFAFAHAFDIALVNPETGEHYQPNQNVKVSIQLLSEDVTPGDTVSVVHFPGTSMENPMLSSNSVGNIKAESVEVIENAVVNGAVEFEASSFSIYIVTKDTITRTYTFMNGSAVYSVQTLKDGDVLAEPPAPTKDGAVFQHWSLNEGGEEYTGFGPVTVSETDQSQVQDVILYAVYGDDMIHVTYYAQDGEVYRRDSYVRPTGDATVSVDTTAVDYSAGQKDDGTFMKFLHWTAGQQNLAEQNPPQVGSNGVLTLTKDSNNYDLYPVISEGHWIYFDVNKTALGDENASVSYVAPVFVVNGDSSAHNFTAEIPTTAGYTFDGWYTRRSGGTQIFDASGVKQVGYQDLLDHNDNLANNPTLYAHWTKANTADYTIVIWQQKLNDTGTDVSDEYAFVESFTMKDHSTDNDDPAVLENDYKNMNVDANYNNIHDPDVSGKTNPFYGFTLNTTKSETSKVVKPDNSTVLNVYYDRTVYTLTFVDYTSTTANSTSQPVQYGVWDNAYHRIYYINRSWRRTDSNYGTSYSGTRYLRNTVTTISKPYGVNIEDYFPIKDKNGNVYRNSSTNQAMWVDEGGIEYTVTMAKVVTMPGTDLTFRYRSMDAGARTLHYMWEDPTGASTSSFTGVSGESKKYADHYSFTANYGTIWDDDVYSYEGVTFVGYNYRTGTGAYTNIPTSSVSGQLGTDNATEYNFYYDRNTYQVHFMDSDEDNTSVFPDDNVKYGMPMKDYNLEDPSNTYLPIKEDYVFTGWYADKGCTTRICFTQADYDNYSGQKTLLNTMPANDVIVYAGWEKIRYEVNIEANGGVIGQPNNTNAVYFKNYYDEKVNEYSDVVRNYVNVGPWTEGDTRTHYAYHEYRRDGHYVNGTKVDNTTEDPNVTEQSANWKRTAKYVEDFTETGIYVYEEGAYTLQGWYEVDNGVMSGTPFNFNSLLQHDTTLRAKWRRTSNYTVVYEANAGGVTGMRSPFDQNRYIEGANAIVAASIGAPEGKRFVGWKDKNGTVYAPNALLAITEDKAVELADRSLQITLTAEYADATLPDGYMADYVFLIADGDDGNKDGVDTQHYKQTIAAGETLVSPVNPTKDGMLFDGWFYDQEGKHRFDGFGKIDNPVYTTLYAHFTNVHVVTYYTPDDSGTQKGATIITAQNYRPGEFLNTLYVLCPTDDEHMVAYWTDGTTQYPYNSSTKIAVNSDLTLWAVLAEQEYIRFDLQGGKTADGASTMEPIRIPAQGWPALPAEPVRAGYKFEGWFTQPEGAGFEYQFNKSVDDFKTENGLTGELILYANWAMDTAHPVKAKLTVLWYSQLSAGPDGGYGDENYELVNTDTVMMNVGSYDLNNTSVQKNANALAALNSAFGGNIFHTDRLEMLYEGENPRYAKTKLPNYFEHSTHHDLKFTVEDSGESVLKIYFDRTVYYYKFNLDKSGSSSISTYGNEIHKGNTSTVYTASNYVLPVWLDKFVYPEWPIEEEARKTTADEYWVVFDKNGRTTNNFYGWYNTISKKYYYTALYSIPSDRIDEFDNASVSNKTIELTVLTTSYNNPTVLQYWFDGIHNPDYDQSLNVGTSTYTYDGKTFDYYFRAKDFEGYEVINQNNKRSDENEYCYNNSDADRGLIKTGTGSATQELRTIYQYYRSSEWAGTTFYNEAHYRLILSDYLSDPISISFHGNRNNNDTELEAGWTDKKDDYQIRVDGNPKTSGDVYYYDSRGDIRTMRWNVFVNEVIASRSKTAQHTVIESGKTINYYYRALSYTLTLMSYDGTTVIDTKTVKYKAPVTGENGALADVTRPTADAGNQFKCWSLARNSKDPFSGTMPAHNLVLYAQDEPVPVTVTFKDCYYDENSGKFVYEKGTSQTSYRVTKVYNTELRDFVPEKPTMANATFAGWTDAAGNPISQNTKVTRDMTVYPSFSGFKQYKVIYDLNEGSGTAPSDTNQYVEGAEIVVKQGTGLTKAFTDVKGASHDGPFTHWNTQADGNGRSYFPGDVVVLGQDTATDDQGVQTLTLYAQYNKYRETTLTYDKNTTDAGAMLRAVNNGKTITTEADGTVVVQFLDDTQTQTAGGGIPNTKITIGQDKNGIEFEAYRPGYVFIGWARTNTAIAPEAENGDHAYINTLTKGGNTLYAVWAICKVVDGSGEHTFPTLNAAYRYINDNMSGSGTIEMLVDYTMPDTDALTVEGGKNITLTTAPTAATDTASQWKYHYVGANKDNAEAPYAVLKRGFNGGSMFTSVGTFTTTNIILDGNKDTYTPAVNGGIVNVAAGTLSVTTGAKLQNSKVSGDGSTNGLGGAVYVASGAVMNLNAGTISGNEVASSGNGAGIYLLEGSTLNISGSPSFGGTTATDGNHLGTGTNAKREDIYIAGYLGKKGGSGSDKDDPKEATSLIVTGPLNVDKGSIWVGAQKENNQDNNHWDTLKQFAKFANALMTRDSNGNTIIDSSKLTTDQVTQIYEAFRNAVLSDETYGMTGDGQTGGIQCIYWEGVQGSRKVILRKVNNSYTSLPGGNFKILKGSKEVEGTDINGRTNVKSFKSGSSGVFYIGTMDYGTYFINETEAPSGGYTSGWYYFILDGNHQLMSAAQYDSQETAKAVADDYNKAIKIADKIIAGKQTYADATGELAAAMKTKVNEMLADAGHGDKIPSGN